MPRRRRAKASAPSAGAWLVLFPIGLVAAIVLNLAEPPKPTPVAAAVPALAPAPTYVSLPADPAPAIEATAPAPATRYVAGHKVPLRAEAGSKGAILDRLGPGQAVAVLEPGAEWTKVRHELTRREGWVQSKRLSDREPEPERPEPPSVGPVLSTTAIAKLLIAESRSSYPGNCACPYHSDRGGRSCGRRAAYVRPGGYAPLCYTKDITTEMVASYRASH